MSALLNMYYCLLTDIAIQTGIQLDPPDSLSEKWVLIEAPQLDKEILKFLEHCEEDPIRVIPSIPEWLSPLWDRFLLTENISVLRCLRELLVFCYKAEHESSNEQTNRAIDSYIDANSDVGTWNRSFDNAPVPAPTFVEAKRLIGLVVSREDLRHVTPSHGPGAVFPPRKPSEKSRADVYASIDAYYPYYPYMNCLLDLGADDLRAARQPIEQIQCKLTAVPKDSRGPRLISVHPAEAVWIQQGQRRLLERCINNHPLTRGRINFDDQSVNGNLALQASLTREYCTLDLKEASDRIGLSLTNYLFGYLSKLLNSTRATHCVVRNRPLFELQMFAPMGNALTFPVESLVFWSLVRAGIRTRHGENCDDVYVFGDDIVFPTRYYDGAIWGLVQAGLLPNEGKTFRKGFFRESCGVDAYRGKDVTPHRVRVMGINSYSDCVSLCSLAKELRIHGGYDCLTAHIYSSVSKWLGWRISLSNNPDSQGIYEYVPWSFGKLLKYEPRIKFSRFHTWEVPTITLLSTLEVISDHAWWHVQDSLLSLEVRNNPKTVYSREYTYSERGLEYPTPRGVRPTRGVSVLLLT
jgi:hypothetical protein